MTITFKNTGDLQYFIKPVVSIKKLVLFQSSDDEDMETEAGAIIGITNLMLKKQLKNQTISLTKDLGIDQYLPCFHLNSNKLDVAVVPGFIDVTLYESDKAKNCEDLLW